LFQHLTRSRNKFGMTNAGWCWYNVF